MALRGWTIICYQKCVADDSSTELDTGAEDDGTGVEDRLRSREFACMNIKDSPSVLPIVGFSVEIV